MFVQNFYSLSSPLRRSCTCNSNDRSSSPLLVFMGVTGFIPFLILKSVLTAVISYGSWIKSLNGCIKVHNVFSAAEISHLFLLILIRG